MNRVLISTASALALMAAAAQAQDAQTDAGAVTRLETITVTANRTPTEKTKVGSKVEQVTQAEIEEKTLVSVRDYLIRLPGISLTSNGGLGTTSNLYIRGMPGGYIKTLYNGIDVSDTTGIQVQAAYEYLLTGGVTGIEVLKGSQGTLYGSSAIAGVVDISTLGEVENGISHTVHVEAGSFGTARARYGFAGAREGSKITANVTGFRTDGISAAAGFPERDGYENVTLDLAAEHRINEAFSVFGSLLYVNAAGEFDDFDFNPPYLPVDNLINRTDTEIMAGRVGFNLDLMDGRWKHTFSAQAFKMDRDSTDATMTSTFIGTRQKFDYQSSFEATEWLLLQYGADHERQKADTTTPDWSAWPPVPAHAVSSSDLTGIWAQAVVEPVNDLVLTAGLRHDDHSDFGGHTTWRGTASYLIDGTGTRLHSSLGTGFRAPSLYQLYDPNYGNAGLKPETSLSFDIGVEQKFLDGRLTADVTYFWAEIEDLIGFAGRYTQVSGTTRSQGIEASFAYAVNDWFDLGGSYTYTDSRAASGARTNNVPKHMAVLSASVKPAEKWTISGDVKFVADTVDSAGDLDDYVLLNAKVAYQVTDATEVYLRGENLLDQDYQSIRGYGTPGIAAYAGFKTKF
jgi:vitamin B12 transporter